MSDTVKIKPIYRDGLDPSDKVRYENKLAIVGGVDPYECKEQWSEDVGILPSVTYPDIVNYLIFTPSRFKIDDLKAWKSLEAVNQLCSGWVRDRVAISKGQHVIVKTKVFHSQRLREKPLQPWVIAKPDGVVAAAHCDCMAGLGEACTHVAALLFSIMAAVEVRDSATATEGPCKWKPPLTSKTVHYKEVSDIDFTSKKLAARKLMDTSESVATPTVRRANVTKATESDFLAFCEQASKLKRKPALLSVVEPYADSFIPTADKKDLPKPLTDLRNPELIGKDIETVKKHCEVVTILCSSIQAANVEEETRGQAKSSLWFQLRAGRITASKAKAVCSTNPVKPSASLVKGICYPDDNTFQTAATKWGKDHEEIARNKLMEGLIADHEGVVMMDCGLFISPEKPFLGASPDGIVSCLCCGSACVEIKCPFNIRSESIQENNCKFLASDDGKLSLNKAHAYYYQVQLQMGITNKDMTYFVVWTTKDIFVEKIAFNRMLFDEICAKSEQFFRNAILPELVGKVYTTLQHDTVTVSVPIDIVRSPLKEKQTNQSEQLYCICNQVEFGRMIGCDNSTCAIEWFHYGCVNIESAPKGKWYCSVCRKLPMFKRRRVMKD
ncbi:uncharacterized protein LOC127857083 [Dreissena polymorpha]|uniref:Inhibitor of growth protein 3 n=1 Tax=Dreissena polymorpha TaxID=45954 RepID=A0A9D3Z309_DREPO|nr:uncharacterized protein LOC127857083 [Dreissena polymorpha]KAH3709720.1 hypothetical protein DPMN_069183 [Dreissena polymorpha]